LKKKIVSGIMLTLLLANMLTLALKTEPVRAIMSPEPEYPAIYVDPPVIEGVMPGNNVTVSIRTDYFLDDIMAWQFSLTYNPLVLHGVEVTNGDLIVGGSAQFKAVIFNNTLGKLSLTVAFYFAEGEVASGPGTLVNVAFTVVDYGYSDLILEPETKLVGWDWLDEEIIIMDGETMPDHLGHGYFSNDDVIPHDVGVTGIGFHHFTVYGNITVTTTHNRWGVNLIYVDAEISNNGEAPETVETTFTYAIANVSTTIGVVFVDVAAGSTEIASVSLDTEGFPLGYLPIKVEATTACNEENTLDNNMTTTLLIKLAGDCCGDSSGYPPDGDVDWFDFGIFALNFGKTAV
jgi:hypothetical protein